MKLNNRAFALSGGIVLGVAFLVITFIWIIFGYEGSILVKLKGVFFGYRVTWWGAFIALLWGFIYGAIGCWIFAWLYNRLEK